MIDKRNITAIILAGGKSSRMGADKGLLQYKGKTFTEHVIKAVEPLVRDVMLVSKHKEYDIFKLPRYGDLIPGAGPLGGLYTGLYYSQTENNIVLSCDVPLINTGVLRKLIIHSAGTDVVHFENMPLVGLYKKTCLSVIKTLLDKGERRVMVASDTLKARLIRPGDSNLVYLANINTPEDLENIGGHKQVTDEGAG